MTEKNGINRMVEMVAEQSIYKASLSLSKMLKAGASIDLKRIAMADIGEVTESVNQENEEVTGAFVDLTGDAPFKFLFYVDTKGAFVLTDLLLRKEPGYTTEMSEYVTSTIQEIGNILASAVANTFSADFRISMLPSPPVVVSDFSGALFQEFLMESAMTSDKVMLLESQFNVVKASLRCRMFIVPQSGSEKILEFSAGG